jgi:hypothetical protein
MHSLQWQLEHGRFDAAEIYRMTSKAELAIASHVKTER